jgi:hypothetical protein
VGSRDKRIDIFKGELQLHSQPAVHSSLTGVSITPPGQVACKKMESDMRGLRLGAAMLMMSVLFWVVKAACGGNSLPMFRDDMSVPS